MKHIAMLAMLLSLSVFAVGCDAVKTSNSTKPAGTGTSTGAGTNTGTDVATGTGRTTGTDTLGDDATGANKEPATGTDDEMENEPAADDTVPAANDANPDDANPDDADANTDTDANP